ncbi:MAG: hypothetical protein AB1744_03460 [Candidatus Zixiibacteriota bacterium]
MSLSQSYTDNLLADSGNISDSYSRGRAALKYYPFSNLEVELAGQYTYYSELFRLSNFLSSAEVTYIPTSENSPLTVYLSAKLDRVRYREFFDAFDNRNVYLRGAAEYAPASSVRFRTGVRVSTTRYVNADSIDADSDQYELLGGVNLTLPGSNSLDIETGWGHTNYTFIPDSIPWINSIRPDNDLVEGDFSSFFVSPRFSRPLGQKTGISITYTYRRFSGHEHGIVLGYATGFLSPWASMYDGSSVLVQLKTYSVPHWVISAGIGYWERRYFRTAFKVPDPEAPFPIYIYPNPEDIGYRSDYHTRVYFSFRRPVVTGPGRIFEPTLTIDISDNNSSLELHYYQTGVTVSIGLAYRR